MFHTKPRITYSKVLIRKCVYCWSSEGFSLNSLTYMWCTRAWFMNFPGSLILKLFLYRLTNTVLER